MSDPISIAPCPSKPINVLLAQFQQSMETNMRSIAFDDPRLQIVLDNYAMLMQATLLERIDTALEQEGTGKRREALTSRALGVLRLMERTTARHNREKAAQEREVRRVEREKERDAQREKRNLENQQRDARKASERAERQRHLGRHKPASRNSHPAQDLPAASITTAPVSHSATHPHDSLAAFSPAAVILNS